MSTISSDFNLEKISTKQLSDVLRTSIEYGGNSIIVGPRGSGKTFISKAVIQELGYDEVFWNLSVMDKNDALGYPKLFNQTQNKENANYVEYILPHFYKKLLEGDRPVVCLLDEVDKADQQLWAPLLEFTQFRTMNGRPMPNLKAIIMTANLQCEGGQRPIPPLLDRAEKYIVETNIQNWIDWAAKEGNIHASIMAYLNDNPGDLHGDVDPGDVYADATPRGWHNASNILNFGEKHKWPHNIMALKVAGCVGKKIGIKYSVYFDHYQVLLPLVDKIMKHGEAKGFEGLEPSKQIICAMIVGTRLARIVDERPKKMADANEFPPVVETVGNFLQNIDPEVALLVARNNLGFDRMTTTGLIDFPQFDKLLRMMVRKINGNN